MKITEELKSFIDLHNFILEVNEKVVAKTAKEMQVDVDNDILKNFNPTFKEK